MYASDRPCQRSARLRDEATRHALTLLNRRYGLLATEAAAQPVHPLSEPIGELGHDNYLRGYARRQFRCFHHGCRIAAHTRPFGAVCGHSLHQSPFGFPTAGSSPLPRRGTESHRAFAAAIQASWHLRAKYLEMPGSHRAIVSQGVLTCDSQRSSMYVGSPCIAIVPDWLPARQ
jgi:hypothetical protein